MIDVNNQISKVESTPFNDVKKCWSGKKDKYSYGIFTQLINK